MKDYFSLWTVVPAMGGSGTVKFRQVKLYVGVLFGALSKVVYDYLVGDGSIDYGAFLIAAIASIVVFPHIYYQSGLNKGHLTFAKWCLAFQSGFFWGVTMGALSSQ